MITVLTRIVWIFFHACASLISEVHAWKKKFATIRVITV